MPILFLLIILFSNEVFALELDRNIQVDFSNSMHSAILRGKTFRVAEESHLSRLISQHLQSLGMIEGATDCAMTVSVTKKQSAAYAGARPHSEIMPTSVATALYRNSSQIPVADFVVKLEAKNGKGQLLFTGQAQSPSNKEPEFVYQVLLQSILPEFHGRD